MNSKYFFQNDDLGPFQPSSADIILRQQLEKSLSKFFYENCDRKIRDLLSVCRWYVSTHTSAMTLVIECPDQVTNWRVLQKWYQWHHCWTILLAMRKFAFVPLVAKECLLK